MTLAFAPSDAMILSNDFGAPPSTSTKPSPVKNARTLLPPPSTTTIWSVRRRTPPDACCALRTREDAHVANTPRAPFNTSLRFTDTAITSSGMYQRFPARARLWLGRQLRGRTTGAPATEVTHTVH